MIVLDTEGNKVDNKVKPEDTKHPLCRCSGPERRCWRWGPLCCPPRCRKWRADGPEGKAWAPGGGYSSEPAADDGFNPRIFKQTSAQVLLSLPFHSSSRSWFSLFYRGAVGTKAELVKPASATTWRKSASAHLQEEAFVCACGVVGGQVGSDQQELGVIRQFDVSVSGQT